jgi:phage virion morphogenesis protein
VSEDLAPLLDHIGAFIDRASPRERRKLVLKIARDIRRANAERIGKNVEPDGAAMTPRKHVSKSGRKSGPRAKKAMFDKLWRARHLKAKAPDADTARVEFSGGISALIARVSQFGLQDRVTRTSNIRAQYPRRRLLGFADGDEDIILKTVREHFEPL